MKQKNPPIQFSEVKNKFLFLPLDAVQLVKTGLPGIWQEIFFFLAETRESQTSLQKYYQSMYFCSQDLHF